MPGVYTKEGFDLAGFSVGVVDKNKILSGQKIKKEMLLFLFLPLGFTQMDFL
jgi:Phosphoribosylaminoimidazole (AIR) synthetase